MRINLTSVQETKDKERIEQEIKKIFPEYTVTVIGNIYATENGREYVRKYSKNYYEQNKASILKKKKEREHKKKELKQMEKEQKQIEKEQKQMGQSNNVKVNRERNFELDDYIKEREEMEIKKLKNTLYNRHREDDELEM